MVPPRSVMRAMTAIMLCVAGGATLAQSPADPQPSLTTAAYGNWLLVCREGQGSKVCEVDQNVADKQGRPVMRLRVGRITKNSSTPSVVAQLPVDIAAGHPIAWQVGDLKVPLTLRACLVSSCFADSQISDKTLTALEHQPKTAKAQFTMARASGAQINIPLSFDGFTDAWRASNPK